MEFETKIAIAIVEDLPTWQKLNVVAFLTSGVMSEIDSPYGATYKDASESEYTALCVQPMVILKASQERLRTFLSRANSRGVKAAVYIEDMFATGHDAANRETVARYPTEALPLVGVALRADKKTADKIFKGAKLHD